MNKFKGKMIVGYVGPTSGILCKEMEVIRFKYNIKKIELYIDAINKVNNEEL